MNFQSVRLPRVGARLAAGVALVTLSCAAHARVVWQLHDFAFTDGATATGAFTWDETLHRPTAWNISTTAGCLPRRPTRTRFHRRPGDQPEFPRVPCWR
jgi:hypothetical protein